MTAGIRRQNTTANNSLATSECLSDSLCDELSPNPLLVNDIIPEEDRSENSSLQLDVVEIEESKPRLGSPKATLPATLPVSIRAS